MSDYISRDKVAQAFEDADVDVCEDYGEYHGCEWGFSRDAVRKIVAELPAADVVEVVRCDNCVSRGNCLAEDTFRTARIVDPYCCAGRQKGEELNG